MNYKYDISIVCPGIRVQHWERLVDSIKQSCKRYNYEIIFCGPHTLPTSLHYNSKIKYIKDFGTPSRAFQIGLSLSEGKCTTWTCDDCKAVPDAIDTAIDKFLTINTNKDILGMRYSESKNFTGKAHEDSYYIAGTHRDLSAPRVDPSWSIPCIFLMNTDYYYELGGLDCKFEHINFNVHDLGFRAQMNGSKCFLSPDVVWNADWVERDINHPVVNAFAFNDRPLFYQKYSSDVPIKIDFNNWKNADIIWKRRGGDLKNSFD